MGGKLDAKFPSTALKPNLTNDIIKGVASGIAGNVASQLTQIAIDGRGRLNWSSVAVSGIYGVGSGFEVNRRLEASIAEQRAAQGSAVKVDGDSAQALYNANMAAAQNAQPLSMMASPSLKATNDAVAARQQVALLNASGGQVTPLLFGNDASAGGGYSLKAQQLAEAQLVNAKNGGLNVTVTGAPPRDVVVNDAKTVNLSNAAGKPANQGDSRFSDSIGNWGFTNANKQLAANANQLAMYTAADKVLTNNQLLQDIKTGKYDTTPLLRPYSKAYDGTYLVDGSKNPSVTPEQYRKNSQESFDRAWVGSTLSAVPAVYGMATGLTLATFTTGAAIGGGINAGAQYVFEGEIKMPDLIGATVTGGLTYGRGLGYSMLTNIDGAVVTARYTGEPVLPKVVATMAGTYGGFKFGNVVEGYAKAAPISTLINGNYSLGVQLIPFANNAKPIGAAASSSVQEPFSKYTEDYLNKK